MFCRHLTHGLKNSGNGTSFGDQRFLVPLSFKDMLRKYSQFVTESMRESNIIASLLSAHHPEKDMLA